MLENRVFGQAEGGDYVNIQKYQNTLSMCGGGYPGTLSFYWFN